MKRFETLIVFLKPSIKLITGMFFGKVMIILITQTIRQLLPKNCLSVFNHFVVLALKGLIFYVFSEEDPLLDAVEF